MINENSKTEEELSVENASKKIYIRAKPENHVTSPRDHAVLSYIRIAY